MIKSASFKNYWIKEFIQFIHNTLMIVSKHNPEKLKLKALHNTLSQHYQELDRLYKQDNSSDITPKLTRLDEQRDQAIICLHSISKGYARHFDEKKAAAGKKLTNCINKHGNRLYHLNYSAETAALDKLIHDLQTNTECVAALQELQLTDLVDIMQQTNTEFDTLFVQRLEQFSLVESVSGTKLMQLTTEAYRTLVQHIEAHAMITPSVGYTLLIKHLNENISHFNKVATRRRSAGEPQEANTEATDEELTEDGSLELEDGSWNMEVGS